jgi:hypothetical protein
MERESGEAPMDEMTANMVKFVQTLKTDDVEHMAAALADVEEPPDE